MKKNLTLRILACCFAAGAAIASFSGCTQAEETSSQSPTANAVGLIPVAEMSAPSGGDVKIVVDTETKVEYLFYISYDGNYAITPRLKADGKPFIYHGSL